ncbi:hypothetical protein NL676_030390 [Syzygium grande]|nr:hypothetical protein NL676_030390 [Syzygium grande]
MAESIRYLFMDCTTASLVQIIVLFVNRLPLRALFLLLKKCILELLVTLPIPRLQHFQIIVLWWLVEVKGLVVVLTAVDNGIMIVLIVVMVVIFKAEIPFVVVVVILLWEHVVVVERTVFVLIVIFLGTLLIIIMTFILNCGVYMLLLIPSLGLLPLDLLLDKEYVSADVTFFEDKTFFGDDRPQAPLTLDLQPPSAPTSQPEPPFVTSNAAPLDPGSPALTPLQDYTRGSRSV